jgi:serine/threonine-protein kinase
MDPISRLNAALEGRYRVERELGEGGMATVYLARDEKHNRNVALKVLKPELGAVIGAERFLAEIETTANLQHPHILPLHDSGEADGLLFYVMPYVEGESLRDRLDRDRQLGVDESVAITTKVAAALHAAHERGVIHRDIKPANILLSKGEPLISDFGIALAVSAGGAGRLTETGLSLGTPHYMSPEQATGDQNVGAATDLYALGCVLYEMLVGEPPYTGSTPQAILGKIIQAKPVSATEMRQTVPANVDAVIRKTLEKVPADRFRTANEFVAALGDSGFRHGHAIDAAGTTATPVASAGLWNRLTVAFATVAVVMTLAFGWALLRPDAPVAVSRFEVAAGLDHTFLESNTGVGYALSPDGRTLVYEAVGEDGVQRLWIRPLDEIEARPLAGTDGARHPVFSPDGTMVAFRSADDILAVPLTGGPARTLIEGQLERIGGSYFDWSADGRIYFTSADDLTLIRTIPTQGGEAVDFTVPHEGVNRVSLPHALPEEKGLLVTLRRNDVVEESGIGVVGPEGGEVREILPGVSPRYVSTGHVLFVNALGTLMSAPFDVDRLEVTGQPVPIVEGVAVRTPGMAAQYAVTGSGHLVYRTAESMGNSELDELMVVDLAGNAEALPLAPREIGNDQAVRWSPDGESIVFQSLGQLYTYNTVLNTTPRQITFVGGTRQVYSPDGTKVAFSSNRRGTVGLDLFVKDLNDDSPPRSIMTLDANQFMADWPADTLIVFEQRPTLAAAGRSDLWVLDISDPDNPEARPYLTSEANLARFTVSPDGTLAAYRSNESGQNALYVRSFPTPGGPTIVYSGNVTGISWSPDGGTLYAMTGLDQPVIAARLQRDPVPAVLGIDTLFVSPTGSKPAPGTVLHPDGDRFILAVAAGSTETTDEVRNPVHLVLVQNFFEELRQRMGGER